MVELAKSVVTRALAVVCPACQAPVGQLCTRADGQRVEYKGHLGVHGERFFAARHVIKGTV